MCQVSEMTLRSRRKIITAPKVGTGYTVAIYVSEMEGNKYLYFPTLKDARDYATRLRPEYTSASILKPVEYVR